MFDPQSRYALVEQALMAPGKDFITGAPAGPFIDTKRDIQFAETGRAYLSVATVLEMAEGADLFVPLREEVLTAEAKGYQLGYADATRENLRGVIADLHNRLGELATRLDDVASAENDKNASGVGDEEPLALVFDGPGRAGEAAGEHQGVDVASLAAGQNNRATRRRRPAGVSVDSSYGNGQRI